MFSCSPRGELSDCTYKQSSAMGLKCLLIAMQTEVRLNHLYIMGSLLVSSARVASMINYMNELCFMNYRNIMESSCKPIDIFSVPE